ncbi:malonate decarboxylase holo-ACP synthase [Acinetobacter sp. ANC 4635]|uniref:malonate decarboxylase holo-ACP synthase n=1 Tax=Acinetobacter sp. ANC 4635 TaxID=2529846 RepID=UPI00103C92EA|nr:malonate decarboxylase holo-ACP synthase [Acinetobacter sp. ANC 4635]TCB32462.1 malonate decarboxylase holo-ACP synthase [Acinetobacter sp. ANC 4635]
MISAPQPHDLLWGMPLSALPEQAPDWVWQAIAAGQPVVVRRAVTESDQVAVGIRGAQRQQRFACLMPKSAIQRIVKPEQLIEVDAKQFLMIAEKVQLIAQVLQATGWVWGITGSTGFELATGMAVTHANSDLDLLIRMPNEFPKAEAKALLAVLQPSLVRVDVQLQTPYGGVALADWANSRHQVLLKRAEGAVLVDNPWMMQEVAV